MRKPIKSLFIHDALATGGWHTEAELQYIARGVELREAIRSLRAKGAVIHHERIVIDRYRMEKPLAVANGLFVPEPKPEGPACNKAG